jgi:hypothetical protein
MLPARFLCSLLTLSRIRWMAIRPSNSPLYAFATSSVSKNDPTTLPHPLLHSSTNSVEHKVGNSSLIYSFSSNQFYVCKLASVLSSHSLFCALITLTLITAFFIFHMYKLMCMFIINDSVFIIIIIDKKFNVDFTLLWIMLIWNGSLEY